MTVDQDGATKIPGPEARFGSYPANSWGIHNDAIDLTRSARRPPDIVTVDAGGQAVRIDLARSGVIVIDLQNDFCASGGWKDTIGGDISSARRPIGPVNDLTTELRQRSVPIIWLNWGNRPDRANLPPSVPYIVNPTGRGIGIGDPLATPGARVLEGRTWSTALVDELRTAPTDIHVEKFRMSGFWDTELESVLRNLGVTTLFFGGVNIDQCVLATLMDAAFIGYDCILLEDCSATSSPQFCTEATLYNVRRSLGFVTNSKAVISALQDAKQEEAGKATRADQ